MVSHRDEFAIDLTVYRYEMLIMENHWEPLTGPSAILYMLTKLSEAYQDVPRIIDLMHDKQLEAITSYAKFRARKHLDT